MRTSKPARAPRLGGAGAAREHSAALGCRCLALKLPSISCNRRLVTDVLAHLSYYMAGTGMVGMHML